MLFGISASMSSGGNILEEVVQVNVPVTGGAEHNVHANIGSEFAIFLAIMVVLVVVVIFYLRMRKQKMIAKVIASLPAHRWDSNGQRLGAQLAEQGWVLYTRPGCPWCTKQMDVLGNYPNLVVCDGSASGKVSPDAQKLTGVLSCNSEKITGFPFWHNVKTGVMGSGMQSEANLRELAALTLVAEKPETCNSCTKEVCAACNQ
ncbi:MAG: hypothetical protein WCR20_16275 [Verrucomicrobiota bacterium]